MTDELVEINRLSEAGKDEEVVALAGKRLGRSPDCRETRVLRATALEMLKKLDEAIDDWTAVMLIDPDDAAPYYARGTLHFRRRRYAQALADFNRAEALDDGYFAEVIHIDRGWCHLRLGDLEKAEDDVRSIAGRDDLAPIRRRLEEELRKAHQDQGQ